MEVNGERNLRGLLRSMGRVRCAPEMTRRCHPARSRISDGARTSDKNANIVSLRTNQAVEPGSRRLVLFQSFVGST